LFRFSFDRAVAPAQKIDKALAWNEDACSTRRALDSFLLNDNFALVNEIEDVRYGAGPTLCYLVDAEILMGSRDQIFWI
jgi:hypothetical protein